MVRVGVVLGLGLAAITLVACQQTVKNLWVRTDGQTVKDNPALASQFEVDKVVCEGEMSKANLSGTQFCRGIIDCASQSVARSEAVMVVAKGCMAQRGYILVPETEAEAKSAEFRRAHEASQAMQAADAAAPAKPAPPRRR